MRWHRAARYQRTARRSSGWCWSRASAWPDLRSLGGVCGFLQTVQRLDDRPPGCGLLICGDVDEGDDRAVGPVRVGPDRRGADTQPATRPVRHDDIDLLVAHDLAEQKRARHRPLRLRRIAFAYALGDLILVQDYDASFPIRHDDADRK